VPSDFEGRVPEELFTDAHMAANPVEIGPPTRQGRAAADAEAMSDNEKDKIMAQLQMLGYVE